MEYTIIQKTKTTYVDNLGKEHETVNGAMFANAENHLRKNHPHIYLSNDSIQFILNHREEILEAFKHFNSTITKE